MVGSHHRFIEAKDLSGGIEEKQIYSTRITSLTTDIGIAYFQILRGSRTYIQYIPKIPYGKLLGHFNADVNKEVILDKQLVMTVTRNYR